MSEPQPPASDSPSPSSGARIKELFARVSELPPEARAATLNRETANDPDTRRAVESLLDAYDRAGGFLAGPTMDPKVSGDQPDSPSAQDALPAQRQIGPYKLLQVIGEGGFGTVYLAEQQEPVRRRVALKIIKAGMDTRQVIARFEAERQALAMMDHPNIAKVFDAGATDAGRPYFVMELVKGEPITRYCDDNRLTPRQRLELFIPVCQAVQHAHQKGIIHRDIKPANVMVTLHDGKPVPKVIDFGIAKATQSRLTEKTLFTELKQLIGTPEYMSPEQAEMSSIDIDTRSDIYSLGVLLYELLIGATPFDARELRSKAYAELQRVIREVDPPRPSTRLSTLQALPNVAARRSTEPAKLGALIRGELDWIVMKCLEKDRARRYESASALAADVVHHLADEPVTASPATATYRLGKFARRHRVGLAFALTVLTTLCAALALSLWSLKKEIAARKETEAARSAEAEARDYEKETDRFLIGMFSAINPAESRGKDVLVKDMLDKASKRLDSDPPKHPTAEASVRSLIGVAYSRLGIPAKAIRELERTVELELRVRGDAHRAVATTYDELGQAYFGNGQMALAEGAHRKGVISYVKAFGEDHQQTSIARQNLAAVLITARKLDEAERLLNDALAAEVRKPSSDLMNLPTIQNSLANVHAQRGQYAMGEPLLRAAIDAARKAQGDDSPDVIIMINNLAENLRLQGKFLEAESTGSDAIALARKVLGATHQITLRLSNTQGLRLQAAGKLDEALSLYTDTINKMRGALGEDNSFTLLTRSNAALVLQEQGKLEAALTEFRDVAGRMLKVKGENDPDTLIAENQVALTMSKMGNHAEAEALMRPQLPRARKIFGDQHPAVCSTQLRLGLVMSEQGKNVEAEPLLAEAYETIKRSGAPAHPGFAATYGTCLARLGKSQQAIPILLEAEQKLTRQPRVDVKTYQKVITALADSYEKVSNATEAARWRSTKMPTTLPTSAPGK